MPLRALLLLQSASALLACVSFERVDRRLLAFATLPACSAVTLRSFSVDGKERCAVACAQDPSCAAFLVRAALCSLMTKLCRAASPEDTRQIMLRPSAKLSSQYPTYRGLFYRLTDSRGSFDQVRVMCEQYGMRLWVPEDWSELEAVEIGFGFRNVTPDKPFYGSVAPNAMRALLVYLGLQDRPQSNCITIDNTPCPVTNYCSGEPSYGFEECTSYVMLPDGTVCWNDIPCGGSRYGICKEGNV